MQLQDQWFAEGVNYFIINCDIFLTNSKNYPILSKAHQSILRRHMRVLNTTIILEGERSTVNNNKNKSIQDIEYNNMYDEVITNNNLNNHRMHGQHSNILYYSQYLQHLRDSVIKLNEKEIYEKSYWDVLQTPLQPLSNNLDYSTYETFETDPVKYVKYEEAIVKALQDWNERLMITNKLIKEPLATLEMKNGNKGINVNDPSGMFEKQNNIIYTLNQNMFETIQT